MVSMDSGGMFCSHFLTLVCQCQLENCGGFSGNKSALLDLTRALLRWGSSESHILLGEGVSAPCDLPNYGAGFPNLKAYSISPCMNFLKKVSDLNQR